MFFRRERKKTPTFADRLENLRRAGFTLTPVAGDAMRAARGPYAADLRDAEGHAESSGAGVLMGEEIGALVDGGYQKFFRTPGGRQRPALAEDLKGLHEFEEDLKEGLGQESYYNQSLGTVSTLYLYDRVKDRDRGVPKRAWE
jgi:hypothetical protein